MTIAHRWNAGEQTISMRYGTTVGELIRRSSALETPPYLAHATSNSKQADHPIAVKSRPVGPRHTQSMVVHDEP